jgi:hypothetical protein
VDYIRNFHFSFALLSFFIEYFLMFPPWQVFSEGKSQAHLPPQRKQIAGAIPSASVTILFLFFYCISRKNFCMPTVK